MALALAAIPQCAPYSMMVLLITQEFWVAFTIYLPAALLLLAGFCRAVWYQGQRFLIVGAAGSVLSFMSSFIQFMRIGIDPVYFNHNALAHVVQAVALVLLFLGIRSVLFSDQVRDSRLNHTCPDREALRSGSAGEHRTDARCRSVAHAPFEPRTYARGRGRYSLVRANNCPWCVSCDAAYNEPEWTFLRGLTNGCEQRCLQPVACERFETAAPKRVEGRDRLRPGNARAVRDGCEPVPDRAAGCSGSANHRRTCWWRCGSRRRRAFPFCREGPRRACRARRSAARLCLTSRSISIASGSWTETG